MRAFKRIRSWRSELRTLCAALVAVMFGLGGALSISSAASAAPNLPSVSGITPILSVDGSTVNEVNNIAPSTYAIPSGTTGAAADWGFQVNDNPSTSVPASDVWLNGDQLVINVAGPGGVAAQNSAAGDYVEFDAASGKTPVALVVANGSAGATVPTFTTTLAANPADADSVGLTDQLIVTFTDAAAVTGLNNFTVLIVNVNLTVGAGETTQGVITTLGSYYCQDGVAPCTAGVSAKTPILVVPNAAVINAYAGANAPPVSLAPNTVNGAISPITVTETTAGVVGSDSNVGDVSPASFGYICVSMVTPGAKFTGTPTLSASGTAIVEGTVSIIGGFIQQPSIPPALTLTGPVSTLVGQVLYSSVTTPSTFTFSNLTVNAPGTTGPVTVQVTIDQNAQCSDPVQVLLPGNPLYEAAPSGGAGGTAAQTADNQITIFQVQNGNGPTFNGRIEGSTSEQTAVASLEYEYPTTESGGTCLPNNAHPHPHSTSFGSSVVLTVDGNDGFDSLSAAYLASYVHSGVLLTEGGGATTVDQYTMNAIQQEGVTTVYIVGGTDAISAADATELASTPSYQCGGTVERTNSLGQPLDLQVQRIWGQTADATASAVATWVNSGYVGQVNIAGAFGLYNDVLGATDSGSSQNNPLRTAILVTDLDSQDAESASALSYFDNLPLLLTPEASLGTSAETALLDLGIEQVIEVGGTLVVSNAVNASLTSQGISVLRISGQDGSDTSVQLADFELNSNWTSNAQPEGLNWGFLQDNGSNCLTLSDEAAGFTYYPSSVVDDGDADYSCTITVALARGDFFADGVTSSDVTGNQAYPIILAENPTTLGTYATGFFAQGGSPTGIDPIANQLAPFVPFLGDVVGVILPFGGPLAIAQSTLTAALAAISSGNP